jgi:Phthiocerol/phthiodiolone dimycocerosyl transferase C-terminus
MAASSRVWRALDPAETYFWLLGRLNGMTGVFLAWAGRVFDEGELTAALAALQQRHPFLRARVEPVDGEYAFVKVDGPIPVSVRPLEPGQPVPVAELHVAPFAEPPHPLIRCISFPVTGEDRSVIAIVMHHVFLDGSSGMNLMRQFCRALDGDVTGLAPSDDVPAALHSRFTPDVASPRAAVDVLGAVRAEREGQPAPAVFPFHDRHARAVMPRHDLLVVDGEDLEALLARAKAAGATVTGLIDAFFLEAAADLFDDDEPRWICLASATDLRHRVEPPLPFDDMQLAIGMVATPYLVTKGNTDTLARAIGEQIAREVARGESHLFYRFARTATYPPTDEGLAAFAKWVDSTPQNITISSVGRLDDTGDPPWLRRITATMVPGPNQISFTPALTYRGEMTLSVSTDIAKLPPGKADRFVSGLMTRLGARNEQTTTYEGTPAPTAAGAPSEPSGA